MEGDEDTPAAAPVSEEVTPDEEGDAQVEIKDEEANEAQEEVQEENEDDGPDENNETSEKEVEAEDEKQTSEHTQEAAEEPAEPNQSESVSDENKVEDNQKLLEDVFKHLTDGVSGASVPPEKLSNITDNLPSEDICFEDFCEIVRSTASDRSTDIRTVLAGAFRERFETLYDTLDQYWIGKMTQALGSQEIENEEITKDSFCDVMLAAVTQMSVDAVLEKCEEIMQQKEPEEELNEAPAPLDEPAQDTESAHGDPSGIYSDPVELSPIEYEGNYSPPGEYIPGMGQPIAHSSNINLDDLECDFVNFHLDEIAETASYISSDGVADVSKLSAGKRLYYAGCGAQQRKDEFLRQERERKIMSELGQLSTPHITERGRCFPENNDYNRSKGATAHQASKSHNLEKLRSEWERQRAEAEMQSMQKVELAPMSKYIVETSLARRYRGPVSGWETHRDHHAAKQVRVHVDTRESFIPNINRSSANLTRDGKVFSRLYSDAGTRSDRHTNRVIDYHNQIRESPKVHTNPSIIFRKSPSPKQHPDKFSAASDDSVVHRLLSAGQVMARKKEKLSTLMKKREEQFTFKPQLTERSVELAAAYKERKDNERERRRLEREQEPQQHNQHNQHQQSTPRKSTPKRDSSEQKDDTFLNRSYRQAHQRKERMSALLAEKKEQEFRECTFQPKLCPNSETLLGVGAQSVGRDSTSASPTRIYSRSFYETDDPITPPSVNSKRREASLSQSPFDRSAPTVAVLNSKVEEQISAVLDEWNKIQSL